MRCCEVGEFAKEPLWPAQTGSALVRRFAGSRSKGVDVSARQRHSSLIRLVPDCATSGEVPRCRPTRARAVGHLSHATVLDQLTEHCRQLRRLLVAAEELGADLG